MASDDIGASIAAALADNLKTQEQISVAIDQVGDQLAKVETRRDQLRAHIEELRRKIRALKAQHEAIEVAASMRVMMITNTEEDDDRQRKAVDAATRSEGTEGHSRSIWKAAVEANDTVEEGTEGG